MSGLQRMKFTGSSERRVCEKHGEYESKNLIGTLWSPCPKCSQAQHEKDLRDAQQAAERNRQKTIEAILGRSGIPLRFQDRTFDGYEATTHEQQRVLKICRAYAERFDDRLSNGGGLVMCGNPGTGKTHLACAIANHIAQKGRTTLFMTVMEAVRRVKQTWGRKDGESEADAIRRLQWPDLLILDEVGVQFGSTAEEIILFEVINGRYNELRPTILISNLSADSLSEYLGERVIDRMREGGGTVLVFDWPSKRQEIKGRYGPAAPVDWERLNKTMLGNNNTFY